MSGGAFDYAQYRIDDIIARIEREIERATCERAPIVTKEGVAVYELTGEERLIAAITALYPLNPPVVISMQPIGSA